MHTNVFGFVARYFLFFSLLLVTLRYFRFMSSCTYLPHHPTDPLRTTTTALPLSFLRCHCIRAK